MYIGVEEENVVLKRKMHQQVEVVAGRLYIYISIYITQSLSLSLTHTHTHTCLLFLFFYKNISRGICIVLVLFACIRRALYML
jgi:predicted RND superfamily exporter protein